MSTAQKLLDAMANNPRDWSIEQVLTVARHAGLSVRCPGGSHHILRNPAGRKISVPAHRPVKPVYIKALLRLIHDGQGDEE
ncbi:type II toxin-antitoxin system HicA family toxin [Leptothrix discophora]|uniref:Type II toxin-antitoxin system HicA family toxin n=1 Tax=Leptothrix discophora TaxID=89 RepID=A0ABT9G835_LEPDI|nr:type II toxin-antitoxin system HicA family toxin [Leptothrix discophora]MDP4302639.1 type II toxin-antitoxin system HicA family toxin [Leptothrix discophora]